MCFIASTIKSTTNIKSNKEAFHKSRRSQGKYSSCTHQRHRQKLKQTEK
uniref:Uncharacterized protein n=1 Tax=Anguilla anguilla TaxID=7936 RepID=A0A0E9RJ00_ANGAN